MGGLLGSVSGRQPRKEERKARLSGGKGPPAGQQRMRPQPILRELWGCQGPKMRERGRPRVHWPQAFIKEEHNVVQGSCHHSRVILSECYRCEVRYSAAEG